MRFRANRFEEAWGWFIAASDHHQECRARTESKRAHAEHLEETLRATREKLEELEDQERHALAESLTAKRAYEAAMQGLSSDELGEAVKRVLEGEAAKVRKKTAAGGGGQKGPLST